MVELELECEGLPVAHTVAVEHRVGECDTDWLEEVEVESDADEQGEGESEPVVDRVAGSVGETEGVEVEHRDGDSVPLVLPLPQLLPLGLSVPEPLCVPEPEAQRVGLVVCVPL